MKTLKNTFLIFLILNIYIAYGQDSTKYIISPFNKNSIIVSSNLKFAINNKNSNSNNGENSRQFLTGIYPSIGYIFKQNNEIGIGIGLTINKNETNKFTFGNNQNIIWYYNIGSKIFYRHYYYLNKSIFIAPTFDLSFQKLYIGEGTLPENNFKGGISLELIYKINKNLLLSLNTSILSINYRIDNLKRNENFEINFDLSNIGLDLGFKYLIFKK